DAAQVGVGEQVLQARAHVEAGDAIETLEGRERDRRQPHLRPPERRPRVERDRLHAEDLVADRLVEEAPLGKADDAAAGLREDALGLQEERLPEALRADDDELLA